jgi:putative NIF3 family GTP cyclohydrolase 1 type 2
VRPGSLKEQHASYSDFAWQAGYAEFRVSHSHVKKVQAYIQGQAEHHKEEDFQTKFRRFCKKNGLSLDERYV